ncbi:hypothetical protein TNCV_4348011 [Trichonephila clavipes]|nr:hypothetical protein TNCV_4348011 [Trichonephila clavipes]
MEGGYHIVTYRSSGDKKFGDQKKWSHSPRIQPNRNFVFRIRTRDKTSHGPIPIPLGYRGHNFPSQRLVESSLAHWPGNPRPLVERVTPIDPRSHDDPE